MKSSTVRAGHGGPTHIQACKSKSSRHHIFDADLIAVAATYPQSYTPSHSTKIRIGRKSSVKDPKSCGVSETPLIYLHCVEQHLIAAPRHRVNC